MIDLRLYTIQLKPKCYGANKLGTALVRAYGPNHAWRILQDKWQGNETLLHRTCYEIYEVAVQGYPTVTYDHVT